MNLPCSAKDIQTHISTSLFMISMCQTFGPKKSEIFWLVVWNMFYFSIDWECHHPNWRNHIFQRGRSTTNQVTSCFSISKNESLSISIILNIPIVFFPLPYHMLHVWNSYQHLPPKSPKCRLIYHTWSIWDMFLGPKKIKKGQVSSVVSDDSFQAVGGASDCPLQFSGGAAKWGFEGLDVFGIFTIGKSWENGGSMVV